MFLLVSNLVAADTYYVSQSTGDDGRNCNTAKTLTTPKKTMLSAVACLAGGDTLSFRGGTYTEADNGLDLIPSGSSWGTATTITNYNGETVTFQPSAAQWNPRSLNQWVCAGFGQMYGYPNHYVIWNGITQDSANCADHGGGIYGADGSHHVRFNNVKSLNNLTSDCVLTEVDTPYFEVLNSELAHCGNHTTHSDHCVYWNGDNGIFSGNKVYDCANYGTQFMDNHANGSVDNMVISGNDISGALAGAGLTLAGSNNLLYNNLLHDNAHAGIEFEWGPTGGGSGITHLNNKLFNNTIFNNTGDGIDLLNAAWPWVNTAVQNNIIYGNGGVPINDTSTTPTIDHNVTSNPLFVGGSPFDFHLQPSSPALLAGLNLYSTFTADYAGTPRPVSAAWTAGAYQDANPTISIQSPTSADTYATSSSSLSLSGISSDDISVASVTWTCDNCTVTNGTATGTTSWSQALTLASGSNTIVVTANDGSNNTGTAQIVVTYTPAGTGTGSRLRLRR